MKLNIDKFLTLTAMMATAHLGALACVVEDSADDKSESLDDDDEGDAGGSADDDDSDDDSDPANEDAVDDDEDTADAGAEDGADPVADAGAEEADMVADAAAEAAGDGGEAVSGDAGAEGAVEWTDAGAEGAVDVGGDAGSELGAGECFGGDFAADVDSLDCAPFDACTEVVGYVGTGWQTCWDMQTTRRASVFEGFIACLNPAELADPCGEAADLLAADCAAAADANACSDPDDGCTTIASNCSEIPADDCDALLAPYDSSYRSAVAACFDSFVSVNGADYDYCGVDFQYCSLGPAAE